MKSFKICELPGCNLAFEPRNSAIPQKYCCVQHRLRHQVQRSEEKRKANRGTPLPRYGNEREVQSIVVSIIRDRGDSPLVEYNLGKGPMDIFIPSSTVIECKTSNADQGIGQLFRYGLVVENAKLILAVPVWLHSGIKIDDLTQICDRTGIELWRVDTDNREILI